MAGGAAGTLGGPLGDVCSRLHERLAAVEAEAEQLRTALRVLARYHPDLPPMPQLHADDPRTQLPAAQRLELEATPSAAHRVPPRVAPVAPPPQERHETAAPAAPPRVVVRSPTTPDVDTLDRTDPPRGGSGVPPSVARVVLRRGKGGAAANAPVRERAFAHYRSLGPGRTLRQVSVDLGISHTALKNWAKREAWSKRANLPEEGTGPVPVESSGTGKGGHVSRHAATPAFALPLDEVATALCDALEERGPLTDREFIGHCRDAQLFADATDAALALAFSNVVHDEPKMFRRRKGVVELVK